MEIISIHAPHTGRDDEVVDFHLRINHFNPRAPYGARQHQFFLSARPLIFQSTRPIRGATRQKSIYCPLNIHFNPRAPYGARLTPQFHAPLDYGFQSTRPIRGATRKSVSTSKAEIDFNPRAPYGARHSDRDMGNCRSYISIHAPHTGRDACFDSSSSSLPTFQSTRPIRGATTATPSRRRSRPYFNPRAPYGARRLCWR